MLVDVMVNQLDPSIVARHWRGNAATLRRIGQVSSKVTRLLPAFLRRRAMRKTFAGRMSSVGAGRG